MKLRSPLFIFVVVAMVLASLAMSAHAFNLLTDIQQQTQWTLGSAVDAGTAVVLRKADAYNAVGGQYVGSALASIANYRMVSVSAGGTFFPQGDGTLKAVDTAKVGLNLSYIFSGFLNQPPAILKNLVVGPSVAMSMVSTPHVLVPLIDINYQFQK